MIAKRIWVYGRVQGVGFRWATCCEARKLDLSGWVRNRRDGSVEILAQGADDAICALIVWAHHGPSSARVDRVEIIECNTETLCGFVDRPTE